MFINLKCQEVERKKGKKTIYRILGTKKKTRRTSFTVNSEIKRSISKKTNSRLFNVLKIYDFTRHYTNPRRLYGDKFTNFGSFNPKRFRAFKSFNFFKDMYNLRWFKKHIKPLAKDCKKFSRFYKAFLVNWFSARRNRLLVPLQKHLYRFFFKYNLSFSFRIDEKFKKNRRISFFLKRKILFTKMRLFYGIFHQSKYVRLLKGRSVSDQYQSTLFSLMERRLDVLLYRSCFCHSIYSAQQLVRHGFVTVNGKVIRTCFYPIKFFDKVSFISTSISKMQFRYFLQLRLRRLKFFPLKYLVMNHKYMYFFVRPVSYFNKEVCLPINSKPSHLTYR